MPGVRWGIASLAACALALSACGSSGDETPRMTRAQAQALVAQLERARVTAQAGDLEGTKAALTGFRRQVARLHRAGALSDATARSLRLGAARAVARATSDATPPPASTPTETTPAPAPPAKKDEKKKHEKKPHGKKKGHGEDEQD